MRGGVLWLGPAGHGKRGRVWLRQFLDLARFGQYFLLPLLTGRFCSLAPYDGPEMAIVPASVHDVGRMPAAGIGASGDAGCKRAAFDVLAGPARLAGAGVASAAIGAGGQTHRLLRRGDFTKRCSPADALPLAVWGIPAGRLRPAASARRAIVSTSLLFSGGALHRPPGSAAGDLDVYVPVDRGGFSRCCSSTADSHRPGHARPLRPSSSACCCTASSARYVALQRTFAIL